MGRENSHRIALLTLALATAMGCAGDESSTPRRIDAVAIGVEPVPRVHLYENHSSALIAWRRAGVQNRVLVHLDGHLDLDWLPDETVARIAAAQADELSGLESHPYSLDNDNYVRFGNSNFLYAAARLGIVRRLIWVVPDATFEDASSFARLARETIFNRLQMVAFDEALGMRLEERRIEGSLLGVPVTICRLSDLPPLDEPVLLDVDLDYFTTRSAVTGWITERPWTTPNAALEELKSRGIHTDLVTISLSTIGGHVPPANRWMGTALQQRLRSSAAGPDPAAQAVFEAEESERSGDIDAASKSYSRHTELVPHEPSGWLLLSRALEKAGREDESTAAWSRALELDPLLEHEDLFEGDRQFHNGQYERALRLYRGYLKRHPGSAFHDYAARQNARCLMLLDRIDDSINAFRYVLQLVPENADAHMDLGTLLLAQGRAEEAAEEYRSARRLLPQNPDYALRLGTLYAKVGLLDEAVSELETAAALRPCWGVARGNLAQVLHLLGRDRDAAEHLSVGLALQPGEPVFAQLAIELRRNGVPVTSVQSFPLD